MQPPRSFSRSHGDGNRHPLWLALATLPLFASACAFSSATTISGVGCADRTCNEENPETRRVLRCIGRDCNEEALPGAEVQVPSIEAQAPSMEAQAPAVEAQAARVTDEAPGASTEASRTTPQPATASAEDSPAPSEGEAVSEASSRWKIKGSFEPFERR